MTGELGNKIDLAKEQMIIRGAMQDDARQIAEIIVEEFKSQGKKRMIIWCLKENYEARKFYEKMGGAQFKTGTHKWGNRDYDMVSYIYHLNEL